jgi:PKD repeat protein
MQDPDAQFEETLQEFNQYWENRPITKGSGYKPFQRWAWYMQSRLTPEGTQAGPMRTLATMQRYLATHPDTAYTRGRSTVNGTWQQVGPVDMPINGTGQPNGLGRVNTVAFHPTETNTLFIGAPAGGIWKSTDYGATWANMNNGLTRLGISSIVVHPTTPTTIYVGTGDRDAGDAPGYGVWRSTDGGANWSAWNIGMGNRTVNEILMDPTDPDILIAATNNRIYRSIDGGATWTQVLAGHDCKDIIFKPGDPDVVYASGSDFYRSADNGQTWTQITAGVPTGVSRIALAVSADQPDEVCLLAGDGGGLEGFYRSINNGLTFATRSTTPNILGYEVTGGAGSQAWYDLVAIGDPTDANHVFASGINTWESFDGGSTWSIVTHWVGNGGHPDVHADHHALEYSPHTGDLFLGHDGGISYSSDAGANWIEISSGLAIAQVYKMGQAQTERDLVINGYQDNGTAYYRNGTWTTEIGGDGMECAIDYSDRLVMYGALYYGDIRRSLNGGTSFSPIAGNGTNGITESGAWVTPYKLHPTNPDAMFVGYNNVWRSVNCKSAVPTSAVSWTQISNFGGNSTVRDLAMAPSNPEVMYVSRSGASNFYSTNNASAATPTWTDLEANLPAAGIPADIEIDPANSSRIWIALGNNIYLSTDGGLTWTDFSGTLPNISLNTIVFDEESTVEAMYIGMDAGVYYRDNTMADWQLFAEGLANVEITELEIYYDAECRGNDMLRASTYGRGLWESDLKDPGTLAPDICFSASLEELCTGTVVHLTDNSAYAPTSWTWSITPNTFTFENGTNANSQHPEVSFDVQGLYTISLNVANANGNDFLLRTDYVNVNSDAISLPFTEDFETAGLCATTSDCGTTVCPLPSGWINLTNDVEDDIDWRTDEGGTPSAGTGPTVDASTGTVTGNYLYLEATSCFGRTAQMVSPCIDLSGGSVSLSFSYHMSGADMGELHVDIFADGVWTKDIMTPIVGDQGVDWQDQLVDLNAYAGQVVYLRFVGITGPGFTSDIALDDIGVTVETSLAVEMATFEAEYLSTGEVDLHWQTLSETNHDYFSVERSVDGRQFEALVQVAGSGNSQFLQSYQTRDPEPFFGKNYYRLKQFAMDGSVTLSEVVAVERPIMGVFDVSEVYPNPTDGEASLDLIVDATQHITIQLYNQWGQSVGLPFDRSLAPGNHVLPLEVQHLAAGIYLLRINGNAHSTTRRLLVK